MKACILAAGVGSRLGQNIPKTMVKVSGERTILEHQLNNLRKVISADDTVVAVGFRRELIVEKFPDLTFVYNDKFATTNTSKSLLLGLREAGEDDVLWLNGDVVFDLAILELVINAAHGNLICVNTNSVADEEIKYTIDENGHINELSKGVKNGLGEALGINFVTGKDLPVLMSCLEDCDDNDYFEKGVELAISKGVKFSPLNIGERFCIEIDFEDDLMEAKKYLDGAGI